MKKSILLLANLFLLTTLLQAQGAGTLLFSEDFSNSNLNNWRVVDSSNLGHDWIWTTSAPGGQYSTNIGPLNSATASNGFICLPADLYNTPIPVNGPNAMHAYIISKAIPIIRKPRIEISYQQAIRYCCSSTSPINLEVSTDSVNWTSFNSNYNRAPSTVGPNGETMTIDVSAVLANQDTAYVRFRMQGNSYYYWMIDDLVIRESLPYTATIESVYIDPYAKQQPYQMLSHIPGAIPSCLQKLIVQLSNPHSVPLNNLHFEADLYLDSVYNNASAIPGLVSQFNSDNVTLASGQKHEFVVELNNYPAYGEYRLALKAVSDSIVQFPAEALDTINYIFGSDSIFARDFGQFTRDIGPTDYANVPPADGNRYGILMKVGDSTFNNYFISSSISAYISADINNVGVSIAPRLYNVDYINLNRMDSIAFTQLAGSPFGVTITTAMLDSWITLPFFPPVSFSQADLLVAAVEQTAGGSSNKSFHLGRDLSAERYSRSGTSYLYNNTSWVYTSEQPGIRLNLQSLIAGGCGFVGLKEDQVEDQAVIYPNPSNGKIFLKGEQQFHRLLIRDIHGRLLLDQLIRPGQKEFDLSYLKQGLYFLHFSGNETEMLRKLIIEQ